MWPGNERAASIDKVLLSEQEFNEIHFDSFNHRSPVSSGSRPLPLMAFALGPIYSESILPWLVSPE